MFRAFCSFHVAQACRVSTSVLTTVLFTFITSILHSERVLHHQFQYTERAFDGLIWILQFFPFRDVFNSPRPSSTIAFIYTRSRSGRPLERPSHRRRSPYRGHHLSSLSVHRRTGRRYHGSRRYQPPTLTDRGHGHRHTFRFFWLPLQLLSSFCVRSSLSPFTPLAGPSCPTSTAGNATGCPPILFLRMISRRPPMCRRRSLPRRRRQGVILGEPVFIPTHTN